MRARLVALALSIVVVVAGCGGGDDNEVSADSLKPRLVPATALPGFGLERRLDWSDPVNLVGEGMFLPEATRPTAAVSELKDAHFEGAAGEVLRKGSGFDATEVHIGVAKFKSAADANKVRDWMHKQDLQQPCFVECIFNPRPASIAGVPGARFVVQTPSAVPPPPKGASGGEDGPRATINPPAGAPPGVSGPPSNYVAEFTIGPYLYWMYLQAEPKDKGQVVAGVKLYYAHAKKEAV
jgi:hypothetical protein